MEKRLSVCESDGAEQKLKRPRRVSPQPFSIPHPSSKNSTLRALRCFSGSVCQPSKEEVASWNVCDANFAEWELTPDASTTQLDACKKAIVAEQFDVVILQLPTSGMRRVQYFDASFRKPLRGRQHPFGYPGLQTQEIQQADRTTYEAAAMIALGLETVKARHTDLVVIAPEDFGSATHGEPFSWWQIAELHDLFQRGAHRVATYGCEISDACTSPSPTGWLSTFPLNLKGAEEGWPTFRSGGRPWIYTGPLARKCQCGNNHSEVKSLSKVNHSLPTEVWPSLSDSLLRHRKRNGSIQFGTEGRNAEWNGSYGPELLGEGSPAHWIKRRMESTKGTKASSPFQSTSIKQLSQNQEEETLEDQFIGLARWRRIRPTRGCVEEVRRLQNRHLYIGRGKPGTGRDRSVWANPFKVWKEGRAKALEKYEEYVRAVPSLMSQIPQLEDKILLCHCRKDEACHADVLIRIFDEHFRDKGEDGNDPPEAPELEAAARNRQVLEEEEPDTEPDEGAAPAGSGWLGVGQPLQVGQGPQARGFRDGAGLCSPGRWAPEARRLPESNLLKRIRGELLSFTQNHISSRLFASLACGKVSSLPLRRRTWTS